MLRFSKTRGRSHAPGFTTLPQTAPSTTDGPPDVATNLRRLRQQNEYSLETLARLSGVSRAMLGQIETGKSAPTVTLLWKISKALHVGIGELISTPEPAPPLVLRHGKARVTSLSEGCFQFHTFSPQPNTLGYEVSEISIVPQHREDFASMANGSHATLIVREGTISVCVNDAHAETLDAGDAVLFNAGLPHSFSNDADTVAVAYLIIASSRNLGGK